MEWFRLYSEFATDTKVQMMPEAMQRRLIMLFCFQCQNGSVSETFHETERETSLAFFMRITVEELRETKIAFAARNFIDDDWNLRAWSKRQYASDSSTARVRDFRARQKGNVTFHETQSKRSSNAPEQNRTEQNKHIAQLAARFDDFWSVYPVKKGRATAERKWTAAKLDAIADTIIADVKRRMAEDRQWREGYIPHGSTYVNGRGWEDAIEAAKPLNGPADDMPDFMRGAI